MNSKWKTKNLGEICELINRGISPKYTSSDGVCVLNQKCVRDHKINFDLSRIHDFKTKNVSREKFIQVGDVLVNSTGTGTLGRVAQVKELPFEATVDSHITIARPRKNIFDAAFFGYAMIFIEEEIAKRGDGCGGQTELARNTLKNDFIVTYPESIIEQKYIVTVLDKSFAAIAKAKTNAEKNLKNAKELFESYLQGVFESKGSDWDEQTLGEVCNVIGGGTPSKSNIKFYNGDICWATVRDMKCEIIKDTEHKITRDAVKNSSTNIIPKGNVIIATRVGLGKVCLIENDTAINQDLRGIVPLNPKLLLVDFLYRWLKSIAHRIVEEGTGATVQGVKLPFIKSLIIYIPPPSEQQRIVYQLDALSAKTKKLEDLYHAKINNLEDLKKSILQKAFSGELTKAEALTT